MQKKIRVVTRDVSSDDLSASKLVSRCVPPISCSRSRPLCAKITPELLLYVKHCNRRLYNRILGKQRKGYVIFYTYAIGKASHKKIAFYCKNGKRVYVVGYVEPPLKG